MGRARARGAGVRGVGKVAAPEPLMMVQLWGWVVGGSPCGNCFPVRLGLVLVCGLRWSMRAVGLFGGEGRRFAEGWTVRCCLCVLLLRLLLSSEQLCWRESTQILPKRS